MMKLLPMAEGNPSVRRRVNMSRIKTDKDNTTWYAIVCSTTTPENHNSRQQSLSDSQLAKAFSFGYKEDRYTHSKLSANHRV